MWSSALRSEASGRRKTIITGIPAFVFFGGTNFDVWKFELDILLGRDQPGFQPRANVCWCSETQWSTDETFTINQRLPSVLERFFVAARNAPKQFGRRAVLVEFDDRGSSQIDGEPSNADNATPRSQAVLHTSDTSFRQPTRGNTSVESTEKAPEQAVSRFDKMHAVLTFYRRASPLTCSRARS